MDDEGGSEVALALQNTLQMSWNSAETPDGSGQEVRCSVSRGTDASLRYTWRQKLLQLRMVPVVQSKWGLSTASKVTQDQGNIG